MWSESGQESTDFLPVGVLCTKMEPLHPFIEQLLGRLAQTEGRNPHFEDGPELFPTHLAVESR